MGFPEVLSIYVCVFIIVNISVLDEASSGALQADDHSADEEQESLLWVAFHRKQGFITAMSLCYKVFGEIFQHHG